MTRARREQIALTDTPYYHCIARCVRRAFLCGIDRHTGADFSHRRGWVVDRLGVLSSLFAIDVCAYAVMSNHYHLVLKVDVARAQSWSVEDVIARWSWLFVAPALVQRYRDGDFLGSAERDCALEIVAVWRERLTDISWYMRMLNEHIARRANAEDGCTGRFWEGRFRSQALLDEPALLTCMAYVDLNPIRAGMAATPEQSDFTSVQQRIVNMTGAAAITPASDRPAVPPLSSLAAVTTTATPACPLLTMTGGADVRAGIPMGLTDYLELVDWSGRMVRVDARGAINLRTPPILHRLGIAPAEFLKHVGRLAINSDDGFDGVPFHGALGTPSRLVEIAVRWGRKFFKGLSQARRLYRQVTV